MPATYIPKTYIYLQKHIEMLTFAPNSAFAVARIDRS